MTAQEDTIRDALLDVIDPEVGINIVDLGLVYRVSTDSGRATIAMTMTSPACPLGEYLRDEIARRVKARIPDLSEVLVELIWDPPWTPERMSASARRQLGWPDERAPRD
jgi:metal-sulfur cluster biosynthetic enzyme